MKDNKLNSILSSGRKKIQKTRTKLSNWEKGENQSSSWGFQKAIMT